MLGIVSGCGPPIPTYPGKWEIPIYISPISRGYLWVTLSPRIPRKHHKYQGSTRTLGVHPIVPSSWPQVHFYQYIYISYFRHGTHSKSFGNRRNTEDLRSWSLKHMSCSRGTHAKNNMASWKITLFNRRYIFKWLVFHCHVSFLGGRPPTDFIPTAKFLEFFS